MKKPTQSQLKTQEKTDSTTSDRNKTAQCILEEAKNLFRQKGYSGVSINDITSASHITKPTLYYYYGDKENLYVEVIVEMVRNGHRYLQEGLVKTKSIRHQLYQLTEGFMVYSPTSLTAMLRDATENLSPISLKKVNDAYRYYMVSTFELLFEEGIHSSEIKPYNSTDMAIIYMSMMDAYTCNRASYSGRTFDYKKNSRFVVDVLMDGLAN